MAISGIDASTTSEADHHNDCMALAYAGITAGGVISTIVFEPSFWLE
ncbi:hypothetical protein [Tepidimonas sp.]|nr:hypothetical protein [Tepidimonas sp.]